MPEMYIVNRVVNDMKWTLSTTGLVGGSPRSVAQRGHSGRPFGEPRVFFFDISSLRNYILNKVDKVMIKEKKNTYDLTKFINLHILYDLTTLIILHIVGKVNFINLIRNNIYIIRARISKIHAKFGGGGSWVSEYLCPLPLR